MDLPIFLFGLFVFALVVGGVALTIVQVDRADRARAPRG